MWSEARAASGELFGFERTAAIVQMSAEKVAQTAREFGQDDDITVVTLTRLSAEPAQARKVVQSIAVRRLSGGECLFHGFEESAGS